MSLDWDKLSAGPITQSEITDAIASPQWQKFRVELKGLSNEEKYKKLRSWLTDHNNSRRSQVQVTNYINSLKRGGQIK